MTHGDYQNLLKFQFDDLLLATPGTLKNLFRRLTVRCKDIIKDYSRLIWIIEAENIHTYIIIYIYIHYCVYLQIHLHMHIWYIKYILRPMNST